MPPITGSENRKQLDLVEWRGDEGHYQITDRKEKSVKIACIKGLLALISLSIYLSIYLMCILEADSLVSIFCWK